MSTTNPYSTPQASVGGSEQQFYQPKVFSFSGRIGRLRYLAYGLVWNLVIVGLGLAIGLSLTFAGGVLATIGAVILVIAYIGSIVATFALAVRRLNDLDKSGWMSLLMLVPLVNFILILYLIFGPGTIAPNNYGPQPTENSALVIIGGLAMPIFFFIVGIVAAIAIPAYQDYVIRANEELGFIPRQEIQLINHVS